MIFVLFAAAIAAGSVVVIFYKAFAARGETFSDVPLLIFWATSLPTLLYLALCFVNGFDFAWQNVVFGLVGGACYILDASFFVKAIKAGQLSVALIITNLSFTIPIVLSLIFLGESVSPFQAIGITVFILTIVFLNLRKGKGDGTGESPGVAAMLIYAFVVCFARGIMNFTVKAQMAATGMSGNYTFCLFLYGGAGAACLAAHLISGVREAVFLRESRGGRFGHIATISSIGLAIAVCNVAFIYPQSVLAGAVGSSLQFTVTASGSLIASELIAFIFYKEKLTLGNVAGTICCLAAIILQLF